MLGGRIMRRSAVVAAAMTLALWALSACDKPSQYTLTDTEQRRFDLQCDKAKGCTIVSASVEPAPTSSPPSNDAKPAHALHRASRLYAACDVWKQGSSWTINIADCRPLACETDEQCPPVEGLTKGLCLNGLCIEPTGSISRDDAVLLCLAGTGRPQADSARQIERYAIGSNCASPCTVPTVCRQP